jgi:hypothetical protein
MAKAAFRKSPGWKFCRTFYHHDDGHLMQADALFVRRKTAP